MMTWLLIIGISSLLIGFIGLLVVTFDEFNWNYLDFGSTGFDSWFWKEFKWWIFGMMIVGILFILTYYGFINK